MSFGAAEIARIAAGMWARAEKEAADRVRRHPRAPEMGAPVRPRAAPGMGWLGAGQSVRRPASPFALEEPPRGKRAPALPGLGGSSGPGRAGGVGGRGQPSTAARLAAGYRPAVLKVVSYGHGAARATAIGQYIQKEEAALETHRGQILATQEAVAAEMKDWARDFDRRRPSDDVATFRVSLAGGADDAQLTAAVGAAFAGHRYAYAIERGEDGTASARVVATMAGRSTVRGEDGDETVRERFHLTTDRNTRALTLTGPALKRIGERVSAALGVPAEAIQVAPLGRAGHGSAGVAQQLARLAGRGGARDQDGAPIASQAEVEKTAKSWDRDLNSFTPRDVMHMVLSAKTDTDKDALVRAARGFLHAQFADHKFAFALHEDTRAAGHIHVHAIVAVKGEGGQRLRPGPADLRAWRAAYAEHAQAEGMKVVAVSAAERASSQSYGPRDKAIVAAADRPRPGREARDRAYAQANPHVVEAARQRIARAQVNPVRIPQTDRQRAAVEAGLRDWRAVAAAQPDNPIVRQQVDRLAQAQAAGHVTVVAQNRGADATTGASAAEMRENLRAVNEAAVKAASLMEGAARADWLRRSAEMLEVLAIRTDLKAREEAGVTELTEAEARRLLGPKADAMIARAREIGQAREGQAERSAPASDRPAGPGEREAPETRREAARIQGVGTGEPQGPAPLADAPLARPPEDRRLEQCEVPQAGAFSDRATGRERPDENTLGVDRASSDQIARGRAGVQVAVNSSRSEPADTQAAAATAREPDHDPFAHAPAEVEHGGRADGLSYEELHSTGILTGPVEDDDVQAEKPASQRL